MLIVNLRGFEFDTISECDHCGNQSLCAHVEDPYLVEVFPEYYPDGVPVSWWCADCYDNRKDEI